MRTCSPPGAATAETVSEIANRWGFSQLSRFAHDYKKRYGQSPRETLSQVQR